MSNRIVLATHNIHKREELLHLLRSEIPGAVEILTLDDIRPAIGDIEETGTTLEENALIKARAVFAATNLPTLADDTGLSVDALGGAPGVYSARYAGEGVRYEDNVRKLLEELDRVGGGTVGDRTATFTTVLAYIEQSGTERLFYGEVHGVITVSGRGRNGFGYDPIFAPDEDIRQRTFAEMTEADKNRLSHRAKALRAFAAFLSGNHPAGLNPSNLS